MTLSAETLLLVYVSHNIACPSYKLISEEVTARQLILEEQFQHVRNMHEQNGVIRRST